MAAGGRGGMQHICTVAGGIFLPLFNLPGLCQLTMLHWISGFSDLLSVSYHR